MTKEQYKEQYFNDTDLLLQDWNDMCHEYQMDCDMVYENDQYFFEQFDIMHVVQKMANSKKYYFHDSHVQETPYEYISINYIDEFLEQIDLDMLLEWKLENDLH
jgi:acyl-CoA hydrolase